MISLKYSIYFEWEGDGVYGGIVDDLHNYHYYLCFKYIYILQILKESETREKIDWF